MKYDIFCLSFLFPKKKINKYNHVYRTKNDGEENDNQNI